MKEKEMQPTIHMKNSSIVIVNNPASIIFALFFILLFLQSLFVNRNALNVRKARRKVERRVKGFLFWKTFYSSSYS